VTVRFHAAGTSNPTPQSATVNIPAGRIVEVVDVLGSILNAPVGSGGGVRFTSDQPIAILCRTSNVDPQGIQPGTFGAQQRPVLLASYLSSADAGAVVTAIRQDASFRTNVGFAAGPDGANYRLTLKNAQGGSIATVASSLGPFGWAQPSIADLFPGTAIPADATLVVEVTSGTLDVYDASLDNASGDLVVTPIAPVPAVIPSSASIGPSGGSIRSADGRLTLKVPAGALSAPATLSIAPIANTAPGAIGSAYEFEPDDVRFARPAQVVFAYSPDELIGTAAGALGMASQSGSSWYGILGGSVDPVARTLTVPIASTSPGPQPAGNGLIPQQDFVGNLGPYGSAHLHPSGGTSVPVRGKVDFDIGLFGPSSTDNLNPGFALLGGLAENVDTTWYVDGIPFGNGIVGTVFPEGPNHIEAVYSAPNCLPRGNPVFLGVHVAVLGTNTFKNIGTRIRIIEKDWRIDVIYHSQSLCSGGPPPPPAFSVDFSRSHYGGTFSLDEDSQVVNYVAGSDHPNPQQADSAWCPGFNTGGPCSQPSLPAIDDLILRNVAGHVEGDEFATYFYLTMGARVPGSGVKVTFTCGGQPAPPQPIVAPADPEYTDVFVVKYELKTRTFLRTLPSTTVRVTVNLRPINECRQN
jgi:hypothetical protein